MRTFRWIALVTIGCGADAPDSEGTTAGSSDSHDAAHVTDSTGAPEPAEAGETADAATPVGPDAEASGVDDVTGEDAADQVGECGHNSQVCLKRILRVPVR